MQSENSFSYFAEAKPIFEAKPQRSPVKTPFPFVDNAKLSTKMVGKKSWKVFLQGQKPLETIRNF